MLSTFGAASSRAFGHTSGGGLRFTSSQVFTANGTYTPTAGTKAALFMVFGAVGLRSSSASNYWSGSGGCAYAERYLDSLDASYSVQVPIGGFTKVADVSVSPVATNSTTGASINSAYFSTHDFAAAGGNGGSGYSSTGPTWGYGGGGGGRCGTGGQGVSANGLGYAPSAPVPNSGNEAAGVFDLSPFNISFTYTRYSSQVPKFDTASTAAEIALQGHLNTAGGVNRNAGVTGNSSYSSGKVGSIVIIEFS